MGQFYVSDTVVTIAFGVRVPILIDEFTLKQGSTSGSTG